MLSIIIPALNEASDLPLLLEDLRPLRCIHEVIVVDGGSSDGTPDVAIRGGARLARASRGRGPQLAAGARLAHGDVLCFLHADARLDREARDALERLAEECPDGIAHAFTLRIAGRGWRYRMVEWGTDRRSRRWGLPYGDQGLVLTRGTYDSAGGFADIPVMEDVDLVRALRRVGSIRMLPERITVSARRWQRDGVLRRTLRNWLLIGAYLSGVAPASLARHYSKRG